MDWSPNPYEALAPYSEDGLVLFQIIDEGYNSVYYYEPSFCPEGMRIKIGDLQRQAREAWYSKRHETHRWNTEFMANGMTKHYLTE